MRAATYLGQNDDNSSWQQVMGADVTGEATGGLGKKKEQVRPGGKHRSGNWPLVQASGTKTEWKKRRFSEGFTLRILRRRLREGFKKKL